MTEATDAKPFSIRHFVSGLRQKDITNNWPFPEKYLKLCLNKGFTHILPPIGPEGACFPLSDRKHLAPKETESNIICSSKTCEIDSNKQRNGSVVELKAEYAALDHLCRQMNQLSISSVDEHEQDGGEVDRTSLPCSSADEIHSRTKALWNHHMIMKSSKNNSFRIWNDDNKPMNSSKNDHVRGTGGRRKIRTKKKSLTEIFAVAKHCVLDGFEKVLYVPSGDSFTPCSEGDYLFEEKEAAEVLGVNCSNNDKNSKSNLTEDSLSKKKHKLQRRKDDTYGKPIKKSRLGTTARSSSTLPKDQSIYSFQQGKLMNRSCKSSEELVSLTTNSQDNDHNNNEDGEHLTPAFEKLSEVPNTSETDCYLLARSKNSEGQQYYSVSKTGELSKKMDELKQLKKQKERNPEGKDDMLNKTSRSKDCEGRVRGLGSLVCKKNVFPKSKSCCMCCKKLEKRIYEVIDQMISANDVKRKAFLEEVLSKHGLTLQAPPSLSTSMPAEAPTPPIVDLP